MFTVSCPELVQDVLVLDRLIQARTPTSHGDVIEFHCPCGGSGVRLTQPGSPAGRLVHHQAIAA